MSFGGLCRTMERVKNLEKKQAENSLMGLVLGSNFKRKGNRKSLDTFFWFGKLAVQGRTGSQNSGLELCASTRILLVVALEIDQGMEFQHVSLF